MEVLDLPEPGEPGPGEVIVRPQAVGICGSDFHYFLGEIGDQAQFPRIQGHEVGAVVEAVGPSCSTKLYWASSLSNSLVKFPSVSAAASFAGR